MAKYISLRVEPAAGTAFDYLINVEDASVISGSFIVNNSQSFDLMFTTTAGSVQAQTLLDNYLSNLVLEAKQRPGNHVVVPATDSPQTFTQFT